MWSKHETVDELIARWQQDPDMRERLEAIHTIEGTEARYADLPPDLHPSLQKALASRGINQLYTHQREAFDYGMQKQSFTAVTPTASGKSYCYHLPVLQTIFNDKKARALYLFPTKALAQDQMADLNALLEASGEDILSFTYDGDTSPNIRQKVRKAGHIVMTNPDMLHSGILPHHTKWVALFENLQYIVLDELHTYKGVFGSHVAHVLRRLQRICAFYGSHPTFICTSATIQNPKELAERLTNTEHALIETSGAPTGKKTFLFYNPPIIHPVFGVRRSAVLEVRDLAKQLYDAHIQTIIFAKSRVRVEMLVTYLQQFTKHKLQDETIKGYRGGYLPSERRRIEQQLRDGTIQTVVSTNALELGIDIGQLQACIMTGYPGNIASAWQQAGRAGRRQDSALIVYVAQSTALDQYVIEHPDFFFGSDPEAARIAPDNMLILMDHLKCAAFELPFHSGDQYGEFYIEELLAYLAEEGVLFQTSDTWHWMSERFPAHDISLRSAAQENVVIIDQTDVAHHRVIGEMDTYSAMTLLHEEAIYMHQGTQYQVEVLDWEEKKAYVREVAVDYFTDANVAVELKVMSEDAHEALNGAEIGYGDVSILAQATIFKKIRFDTHDNIGSGPIHLPPMEMHTSAMWFSFASFERWGEERISTAMASVAYVMQSLTPLFVHCDRADISVVPHIKAVHNELPTLFIYDNYPGGIGLSEKMYERLPELLTRARDHVSRCRCEAGCPSCIGAQSIDEQSKLDALALMKRLLSLFGQV